MGPDITHCTFFSASKQVNILLRVIDKKGRFVYSSFVFPPHFGGVFFWKAHMDDKKQIFLTKEGFSELKKEYDELTKSKRPAAVERIAAARAQGDLAENSEYAAAREELSFIDGRIEELEGLIAHAKVIRESSSKKGEGEIKLGSKVTLAVNGKREVFTVVGEWEADPTEKKISHDSPLGRALLGKAAGDKVEVEAPAGKILYAIVDIH